MKTTTHLLALATACAAALFAVAEDAESAPAAEEKRTAAASSSSEDNDSDKDSGGEGFARYQSIIDRQPFGPPPPGFDPSLPVGQAGPGGANGADGKTEAEISAEEQKLMSSVRVSILNVTPAGVVMAGFTDSTTQPPVNYYLKVGDTSTDAAKWTVKEADPAAGTVTLSKDGIDVTLAVGGETKKGSPAKAGPQAPAVAAGPRSGHRIFPGRGPGPAPGLGRPPGFGPPPIASGDGAENARDSGGALTRLREKRMLRHAEEAAQKQAAEKARAEIEAQEAKEKEERAREREQAAAEREQQREALLQIQEELRRQREAKAAQKAEESNEEQPE